MGVATYNGIPIKYIVLVALTVQNAGLSLIMRYSRATPSEKLFLPSTAVIMNELVKAVVSAALIYKEDGHLGSCFAQPTELLKTGVPALLYLVQNNLQYVAVSNLDAATFQVTYQMKIMTTALMSVLILSRKISCYKWLALFILMVGIALVQLARSGDQKKAGVSDTLNMSVGLIAITLACCSSGCAGVYFEKILKGSKVSLWTRNLQLGCYSVLIGLGGLLITADGAVIQTKGFFHGYTPITWCVIATQAGGGLIIAMVIKHADNIVKNFATSLSIILSCVVQYLFMDFPISLQFAAGVGLVVAAVFMYSQPDAREKPPQQEQELPEMAPLATPQGEEQA